MTLRRLRQRVRPLVLRRLKREVASELPPKTIIRDTLEEKLLELQARKRQLFEATIDTDRLVIDELTRDDIVDLLGG